MPSSLLTVTPLTASGISHVFDNVPPAGLVLWLDATKISGVTSGTSLSLWTDNSARASHVSNSLVTQQPLYVNNIINGRPGVRFEGVNTALQTGVSIATAPFTVMSVSVLSSTAAASRSLWGNGRYSGGKTAGVGSSYAFTVAAVATIGQVAGFWVAGTATVNTQTWSVDTTLNVYKNGSLITTATAADSVAALQGFLIARDTAGGSNWPGDVGEFFLYNKVLSTTERQQLESYLTTKWGV